MLGMSPIRGVEDTGEERCGGRRDAAYEVYDAVGHAPLLLGHRVGDDRHQRGSIDVGDTDEEGADEYPLPSGGEDVEEAAEGGDEGHGGDEPLAAILVGEVAAGYLDDAPGDRLDGADEADRRGGASERLDVEGVVGAGQLAGEVEDEPAQRP